MYFMRNRTGNNVHIGKGAKKISYKDNEFLQKMSQNVGFLK